jgi:hypothetical protein
MTGATGVTGQMIVHIAIGIEVVIVTEGEIEIKIEIETVTVTEGVIGIMGAGGNDPPGMIDPNGGVGDDTIPRMITRRRLAGRDRREGATVIKHSHSLIRRL